MINASAHSAAPAVYPNLTYDPAKDFAGVAVFGVVPNMLLVAPATGITTVAALVERTKVGALTFASAGVGSATHWAAERFLLSAGIKATHVPFSGGPAALTEVMTGRVDFCFIGISLAIGPSSMTAVYARSPSAFASARRHCRTSQPRSNSVLPIPITRSRMACLRR